MYDPQSSHSLPFAVAAGLCLLAGCVTEFLQLSAGCFSFLATIERNWAFSASLWLLYAATIGACRLTPSSSPLREPLRAGQGCV